MLSGRTPDQLAMRLSTRLFSMELAPIAPAVYRHPSSVIYRLQSLLQFYISISKEDGKIYEINHTILIQIRTI